MIHFNPDRNMPTLALTMLLAIGLVGCSSSHDADKSASAAATPSAKASPAATVTAAPGTACAMLDAATMSTLLGEEVTAEPDDGALEYGHTDCVYRSADGGHKRLDVAVDSIGGSAMRGPLGIPKAGPATAEHPYADIGDGANLDSGVLFVMLGETRLSIDLSRIDDKHAVAERIVAALKPALQP